MRKLLSLIAVPALAVALLLTAPAFAAAPPAETLREHARKLQGRHAHGLYVGKVKTGWIVEERKFGKHAGKDVLIQTEETCMVQVYEGVKKVSKEKKVTYHALEGEGAVLLSERQIGHGKTAIVQRAVRKEKGMALTTTRGGRSTERLVSFPKETLAESQKLSAWLRSARKGDKIVTWTTNWDSKDINVPMTFTFQEKTTVVWGGRRVPVYAVEGTISGMRANCALLEGGVPFSASLAGGQVTIRMEEEPVAKKLVRGADMSASFVFIDRDLGSSGRGVRKLTLEVKGLDGYPLPQSHRQRSKAGKDKTVIVELQPDFRVEKGSPLTTAEKAAYTRATASAQSDHETIRKLARKIVGDEKDPVKMATLLSKWVHRNIRYDFRDAWAADALTVLDNRSGVCADFALLYVALARSVGLPAREVGGLAYLNPRKPQLRWKRYAWGSLPSLQLVGKPQFGWHAWAEVHDGAQWLSFDPTMNLVYVSATHIKFSEGDDSTWKNLAGKLAIKVVAVEMAGRPVAMATKR